MVETFPPTQGGAVVAPAAGDVVLAEEHVEIMIEEAAPEVRRRQPTAPPRGAPKWDSETRERLKAAVKRFSKPLADLVARDANEGDTRLLVTDFLCDGLGFDKYENLTTEYEIRGNFADYGVRIDKQLVAFIEVKRAATKLNERHLRQVQMYAVNEGVEWVILTNGVIWQVWHLEGGLPVIMDMAVEVDILGGESPSRKAGLLFYVTREAFKRRLIDEVWKAKRATAPKSLAAVLTSPTVAEEMRRELRRTTGQNVPASELVRLLRETVLRSDCLS